MRPILLACRTCLETTGSRVVWYSLSAACKFSAPFLARHLPKTAASNIDMFMLLRPWGVVGWAASPSNTTLSQKICSKGSVSNIKFKKGSFVSWMTHELREPKPSLLLDASSESSHCSLSWLLSFSEYILINISALVDSTKKSQSKRNLPLWFHISIFFFFLNGSIMGQDQKLTSCYVMGWTAC